LADKLAGEREMMSAIPDHATRPAPSPACPAQRPGVGQRPPRRFSTGRASTCRAGGARYDWPAPAIAKVTLIWA
jgi:hypothetical protein